MNDIKTEIDSATPVNTTNITEVIETPTIEEDCEMSFIRPEDVEMFCTEEDVGTNVTICHDDDISDINIVTTH